MKSQKYTRKNRNEIHLLPTHSIPGRECELTQHPEPVRHGMPSSSSTKVKRGRASSPLTKALHLILSEVQQKDPVSPNDCSASWSSSEMSQFQRLKRAVWTRWGLALERERQSSAWPCWVVGAVRNLEAQETDFSAHCGRVGWEQIWHGEINAKLRKNEKVNIYFKIHAACR